MARYKGTQRQQEKERYTWAGNVSKHVDAAAATQASNKYTLLHVAVHGRPAEIARNSYHLSTKDPVMNHSLLSPTILLLVSLHPSLLLGPFKRHERRCHRGSSVSSHLSLQIVKG